MLRQWVALIGCAVVAACSPSADTKVAEDAISSFHADLNAGNFDTIYDRSASDMKAATSKDKFAKILNAVHSKLGLFKSGKSDGWNDNVTTGGHFVTISYQASYERGAAAENFVYRVEGPQAVLAGYHINSDALLLN
jgi:Protein of unknown function (DUF3887)